MRFPFLLLGGLTLFAPVAARAAETTWEPNIYPENQLFSSFVVSTAMINLPEDEQPS